MVSPPFMPKSAFLGLAHVALVDRPATVATGLPAKAGLVGERVHQPGLALGPCPDHLQSRRGERLSGLLGVLPEQRQDILSREVAQAHRPRFDVEGTASGDGLLLRARSDTVEDEVPLVADEVEDIVEIQTLQRRDAVVLPGVDRAGGVEKAHGGKYCTAARGGVPPPRDRFTLRLVRLRMHPRTASSPGASDHLGTPGIRPLPDEMVHPTISVPHRRSRPYGSSVAVDPSKRRHRPTDMDHFLRARQARRR